MKRIWLGLLLAFISTAALSAASTGPLEVSLSHPQSTNEAEAGVIIFTMTNRSTAPIHVLKTLTPFNSKGERLINDLFDFVDGNGQEVKYTGIFVDGPGDAHAYMKMEPGESMSKRINLSKSYDLKAGGPFKLSFTRAIVGEWSMDDMGVQQLTQPGQDRRTQSNTLDLWINTGFLKQDKNVDLLDVQDNMVCESSKQAVIDAALARAQSLAGSNDKYEASLWFYEG